MDGRKARKDCFFGIHMDFHAVPQDGLVVGATLREEEIAEICDTLQPDFIQIDCKGHPGWASYPTALGNAMPQFRGDPLAVWRRVTAERGIALYVHYSGIYEIKYGAEHPEACVTAPNGERMLNTMKADGRYVDELMIPQLKELAEKYHIDGVWVDGECWKTQADYAPEAVAAFEKETGISLGGHPPVSCGDPHYDEYREYFREKFRAYVRRYTDALHEAFPDFQITSNWAYSDHMPEPVSAKLDFLSGDLYPLDSFRSARYAGRVLASQNMPWDLMTWNFRLNTLGVPSVLPKAPVQIMQDAAAVIALGGAFQDVIQQFPDGSPNMLQLRPLQKLAAFLHCRKPYCFHGKFLPQVEILLSSYDRSHEMTNLYARDNYDRYVGLTSLFCDAGQSVEVVMEHSLSEQSPVWVIPELYDDLQADTKGRVESYVKNGGCLILVGQNACRRFADRFGYRLTSVKGLTAPNFSGLDNGHRKENAASGGGYFSMDGQRFGLVGSALGVVSESGESVADLYGDFRTKTGTLTKIIPFGKGCVVPIAADLGKQYSGAIDSNLCRLVKTICGKLYQPIAAIESVTGLAELVCLQKDDRLMLQIVNANGSHANPHSVVEDTIPPLVDLKISLREKPQRITLQPENRDVPFWKENGRYVFAVPRVDLHSVAVVEQK